MRSEIYEIQRPKHIVFGDPMYFAEFKGEKLAKLVVDYAPPPHFTAKLRLQEQKEDGYTLLDMELWLAPSKTIGVYMDGMQYESQQMSEKEIGVDSASYRIEVDGRSDTIHTGGDGYWGNYMELSRQIGDIKICDAVHIMIGIPEGYDFEEMKKLAQSLFGPMQKIDVDQQSKNEIKIDEPT